MEAHCCQLQGEMAIKSKLNFTKIVEDADFTFFRNLECNSDLLGYFIKTDDLAALQRLADVICSLDEDLAGELASILQENLDVQYLSEAFQSLYKEVVDYNAFNVIGDFGDLVGIALRVPSLMDEQDKIPPIAHLELWFHDFQDTIESIARNFPRYDWTV